MIVIDVWVPAMDHDIEKMNIRLLNILKRSDHRFHALVYNNYYFKFDVNAV